MSQCLLLKLMVHADIYVKFLIKSKNLFLILKGKKSLQYMIQLIFFIVKFHVHSASTLYFRQRRSLVSHYFPSIPFSFSFFSFFFFLISRQQGRGVVQFKPQTWDTTKDAIAVELSLEPLCPILYVHFRIQCSRGMCYLIHHLLNKKA